MSKFSGPIILEKLKKNKWKVDEEVTYFITSDNRVTVPKGFITDLASVPWLFRVIIPQDGTYTPAAVLHDYLYSIKDRSRKECDKIFLDAMTELGVKPWKKRVMYRAVRIAIWNRW